MAILTRAKLTELTEKKISQQRFVELLKEAKSESKVYVSTTVFLSHSHADFVDGTVNRAIVFLRDMGIKVYIDSTDSSMPPFTSAATAEKIKQAIASNKKFVLLATDNAINSKWCNWELGYGDAKKYIDGIALFPVSENSGNWIGSEYLRIYPRIEESDIVDAFYKIVYPDGTYKSLVEWLKM